MANYRQVHTKIWKDDWFLDLSPTNKLFFIYLFTNERASLAGIYELAKRVMSFEAGLTPKQIKAAFAIFEKNDKAYYRDGVVWVVNLRKYHDTGSPRVKTRIDKDIDEVRDCELKRIYCTKYGIDTVSGDGNGVSIPPSTSTITSKSILEGGSKGETTEPSAFDEILEAWAIHFPDKPQPRPETRSLRGKLTTRLKSQHFRDNWRPALEQAGQSSFLKKSRWFTLAWFLKNDDNYEKCLNGNYDDRPAKTAVGGIDLTEQWQTVLTLTEKGKLPTLSDGPLRRAVVAIGKSRLDRMTPEQEPFIYKEFVNAYKNACQNNRS